MMDIGGRLLISLGFSPQTHLVLGQVDRPRTTMPFDTGIVTRASLFHALKTDGRQFAGKRGGTCWKRFSEIARSDIAKTFVLSNADHRLTLIADGGAGFERNFGLGWETFEELVDALDDFGARNYRIMFLSQALDELENTASLGDRRLDHRFVGVLSSHSQIGIAARLFAALPEPSLLTACGLYERSGKLVRAISSDVAVIYNVAAGKASACGSLTRLNGGFAAFFEGRDQCLTAVGTEHGLYFSDGSRWSKDVENRGSAGGVRWTDSDFDVTPVAPAVATLSAAMEM